MELFKTRAQLPVTCAINHAGRRETDSAISKSNEFCFAMIPFLFAAIQRTTTSASYTFPALVFIDPQPAELKRSRLSLRRHRNRRSLMNDEMSAKKPLKLAECECVCLVSFATK